MNLRYKILSGFLILALMLTIAGIWSIYHFQFIGNRVNKMMDDEYSTINISIDMLNALEREDSAILLSLLGNLHESSMILHLADSAFSEGLNQVKKTINEENDNNLILEIEDNYNIYKDEWQNLYITGSSKNLLEWYFSNAHSKFLNVQQSVEKLLITSENELYSIGLNLKKLANRATMPGIIAIIAALVFTIMFSFFIHLYFISPITKIIAAVKQNKKSGTPIFIEAPSNDEMAELVDSVNYLSSKINKSSKK